MTKTRFGAAAGAVAMAALANLTAACHRKGDAPATVAPAVTASHPRSEPVTEYIEMTGTVAASKTVNLVARIPGYLESVTCAQSSM